MTPIVEKYKKRIEEIVDRNPPQTTQCSDCPFLTMLTARDLIKFYPQMPYGTNKTTSTIL